MPIISERLLKIPTEFPPMLYTAVIRLIDRISYRLRFSRTDYAHLIQIANVVGKLELGQAAKYDVLINTDDWSFRVDSHGSLPLLIKLHVVQNVAEQPQASEQTPEDFQLNLRTNLEQSGAEVVEKPKTEEVVALTNVRTKEVTYKIWHQDQPSLAVTFINDKGQPVGLPIIITFV